MERDERLEELSDKVREGVPIGFLEAIAVIEYQGRWRRYREENFRINRFKRWVTKLMDRIRNVTHR